jgi:hypothetical protein
MEFVVKLFLNLVSGSNSTVRMTVEEEEMPVILMTMEESLSQRTLISYFTYSRTSSTSRLKLATKLGRMMTLMIMKQMH